MLLEDVLTQRAGIRAYLDTLVQAHRRYLFDVQDPEMLDKLRKDIYICLNDICKLNFMLTSGDGGGSVKQEIDRLAKFARKLEKLDQQAKLVKDTLAQWDAIAETQSQPSLENESSNEVYTFTTHYRQFLNQYLDRVGISNTSVTDASHHYQVGSNLVADRDFDSTSTMQNIAFLRSGHDHVQHEIHQLESLLATLKKDSTFIQQELLNRQNEVESAKVDLSNDLEAIQRSQEKVLAKLNIADESEPPLLSRFGKTESRDPSRQLQDRLNYAKDYVKARQEILNADLKMFKDDLRFAESTRNLWDESLSRISSLEKLLKAMLVENPNTSPQRLSEEISNVIIQLRETNISTDSEVLNVCLGNEIEILKRANDELNADTPNGFPKRHKDLKESLTFAGTSPPKIGINKENVTYSSRSALLSKTSHANIEKFQKKK
ncbi:LAME_0E08438g1_1 [Lachancea meyersii CBS 8951]|uniref:LAME_0E08438g1_1 n=1 Tax=Lachancea meyersii CBS 8951 TaxID=1266667 RepID=A0A1G4JJ83_9SACH|nr:LAME_0E08438g1_1 [Lachancea meyersii CBS 8951]